MVKLELDERDVVQVSRRLHRMDEIAKQDDMEWMHEVTGFIRVVSMQYAKVMMELARSDRGD